MALVASPRSVWATGRPSTAPCASPRKRGELAKAYHSKYHHGNILEQDPAAAREAGSPRIVPSKKPGVREFSDPTNPSSRTKAKLMTNLEDHRNDARRAGGRTRDQGMIPCGDMERSADAKRPDFVAYRYSTDVAWRPSKRCPDAAVKQSATSEGMSSTFAVSSPRKSSGVAQSMAHIGVSPGKGASVLDNYLNDMKKGGSSKRMVAAQPSEVLQKLNDDRFKLPADRNLERGVSRSRSCDPHMESRGPLFRNQDASDADDKATYAFTRKSPVAGTWTHGRSDLLAHVAQSKEHGSPSINRSDKASARFEQIVRHMATKNPSQRSEFGSIRALGTQGQGIFNEE